MKNIFDLPSEIPDEIVEVIYENKNTRIERILSAGQVSAEGFWYDQNENEWVSLVQGEAKVAFDDGGSAVLKAGDHILIKAHKRHRVEYTSIDPPCVWICVFFN